MFQFVDLQFLRLMTCRFLRHKKGFFCASFDFDYDSKAMDFLGCAGFLLLDKTCSMYIICERSPNPRLCIHTVLQESENALTMMAPICSSWGMPARSTSMRTFFNWQGQEHYGFVRTANIMISRPPGSIYIYIYLL